MNMHCISKHEIMLTFLIAANDDYYHDDRDPYDYNHVQLANMYRRRIRH